MEKEFLMPKGNNHICIHGDLKKYWLLCYWCDDEEAGCIGKSYLLFRTEKEAYKYLRELNDGCFEVGGWVDPVNVCDEYI